MKKLSRNQMETLAAAIKEETGGSANVTDDGRHIICLGPVPQWAKDMKAAA